MFVQEIIASIKQKAVTYDDQEIALNREEKQLLERANGRILLFCLSGPIIFGVAKAISRQHNLINDYQALVLDLSEVPILGVTSSLVLENAIKEAIEKGRQVFLVGLQGQAEKTSEKIRRNGKNTQYKHHQRSHYGA